MSETLLPCPFCGGEVKLMAIAGEPYPPTYEVDIANITVESDDICYVHCPTCGANWHIELRIDAFPFKTIAAWNRRADHLPDATKMVTNADRIRSMNDEELATEITKNPSIPCRMCEYYNHKLGHCDARRDFVCVTAYAEALALDWLKQPIKDADYYSTQRGQTDD